MTNPKNDPDSEPEFRDWLPTGSANQPPADVIQREPRFDPRTGMWFQGNRRVPAPGSGRGRVADTSFRWTTDRTAED